MAFIKDTPPPATIILISGDRDFAYLLSTVRWRKYNVILISNSFMTHESLTAQASVAYDWKSDVLNARPPPKPLLFMSQTLSSAASLTTPQGSDKLSETGVDSVGLPNERVAPVIQPSTLALRPAGTVTISAIHPTRSTVPNAPSVEPETILTPPKAETAIETISASITTDHTSDDCNVAGLAGGSTLTMVHPSIVRSVVVDLISTGPCLTQNDRPTG